MVVIELHWTDVWMNVRHNANGGIRFAHCIVAIVDQRRQVPLPRSTVCAGREFHKRTKRLRLTLGIEYNPAPNTDVCWEIKSAILWANTTKGQLA